MIDETWELGDSCWILYQQKETVMVEEAVVAGICPLWIQYLSDKSFEKSPQPYRLLPRNIGDEKPKPWSEVLEKPTLYKFEDSSSKPILQQSVVSMYPFSGILRVDPKRFQSITAAVDSEFSGCDFNVPEKTRGSSNDAPCVSALRLLSSIIPKTLFIVIERGPSQWLIQAQKSTSPVKFASTINIPFFKTEKSMLTFEFIRTYQAVAFSAHFGSRADCGHYVACTECNGKWYMHNDNSAVVPLSRSFSFDTQPVLLVYELVAPPESTPAGKK